MAQTQPMQLPEYPRLTKLTKEIQQLVRRSASDVIEIGKRLNEVKRIMSECPALGIFHEWLEREFRWSVRTAQRFMRVALHFSDIRQSVALSPNVLFLLSSHEAEADAVNEALERTSQGEKITTATAREIIEDYHSINKVLGDKSDEERLEIFREIEAEILARPEQSAPVRPRRTTLEKILAALDACRILHKQLPSRREPDRALRIYERAVREAAKG